MPGNKNSGRKRKATPVQGSIIASLRKRRKTAALTASPQVSLAPGRTRQGTKLAPVPSISNTTRPEIHPLQSPRLASKEFEKGNWTIIVPFSKAPPTTEASTFTALEGAANRK